MRYAIIGVGAVGGYYGGLLARAGREVHFLLHSDAEHVRRHGLRVDSKDGDFILPRVHAHAHPQDLPPCDVVIVALKTHHNPLLPTLLPPALAPDGCVVLLQNGLGMEDAAAAIVGPRRVLGGTCFLCSTKAGPGHIQHLDYGSVALAEHGPHDEARGLTPRLEGLAADFRSAGIEVELCPDLGLMRWRKLVWNVPFNGLSVVLDAATDRLMADPHARALAEELMREVAAGAQAFGKSIPEAFLQDQLQRTQRMVPYRPSMKLDHDLGRPMEVESIFGEPWRRAAGRGVSLPRLGTLYRQLAFLDGTRRVE